MNYEYEITIIKRTPKTEEELKKASTSINYGITAGALRGDPYIPEYTESNALNTVLTEDEFRKVRLEVLKTWEAS